jgi:hypothetical protein
MNYRTIKLDFTLNMNCEEWDRIFARIRTIDTRVNYLQRQKYFYSYQLDYSRIIGAYRIAITHLQNSLERTTISYVITRQEQVNIHKSLTKHYREIHLNGEE